MKFPQVNSITSKDKFQILFSLMSTFKHALNVIPWNILHPWVGNMTHQLNLFHPVLANTNNAINR